MTAVALELTVDSEELWPRTADYRYRLYAVASGRRQVLAAAPTAAGIGQALVTLHEDLTEEGRCLADEGRIGILDVMPGGLPSPTGAWVVSPFRPAYPHRPLG